MLDHVTVFVIGFFFGYVAIYYTRPHFVIKTTSSADNKAQSVMAHDKLFLTSLLMGLIAVFFNVLFDGDSDMSSRRSGSRSRFGYQMF